MVIRQVVILFVAMMWTLPALADVPVLDNPTQAPAHRDIVMTEVWRIGDDDAESFILGVVQRVLSDDTGNIYLLDTQQSEVFKFSPDGEYLKSVSRKGEGPGEIGRCYFFGLWDSETIACFSNFPHKFVRFDLEGIPVASLTPSPGEAQKNDGRMAMSSFIRRDGFLVAQGSFFLFKDGAQSQKFFLSGFNDEAEETYCYGKVKTGYDFTRPIVVDDEADFLPLRRWTLGRNGEIYTAPHRTKYLIEVHDTQGNLLRRIVRQWPLIKRTAEEKIQAKNGYTFGVSGNNNKMPEISFKISDYAPTIGSLNWHDDQLWVTTGGTKKIEAEGYRYLVDIFDGTGNLLESRSYQIPVDPENDRVFWLDGGRAIVVKNYASAKVASRSANTTVQTGDGTNKTAFEDDFVLEVVLYKASD